MRFTFTIDSDNDAMQTADDVADAMRNVAARVARYDFIVVNAGNGAVVDANGNTVGQWGFEATTDEAAAEYGRLARGV